MLRVLGRVVRLEQGPHGQEVPVGAELFPDVIALWGERQPRKRGRWWS